MLREKSERENFLFKLFVLELRKKKKLQKNHD